MEFIINVDLNELLEKANLKISKVDELIESKKKDLIEIPEVIKKNIQIICVKNVDEVLKHALTRELKRVEWVEVEQVKNKSDVTSASSTH